MSKLVPLTIDGQTTTVPEGTLVVDAAKKIGITIPVFCYHPKLEPAGMCRMCLVEIGRPVVDRATGQPSLEADGKPKIAFNPKLETACTTPVSEGMAVITASEKVTSARKEVLEFLLTSHPLDCPVCDKGGECPLQNQTLRYGPGVSRFNFNDKMHLAKQVPLGELIVLDRERCIQCGRCVRFQSDLAGDPVIALSQRGRGFEIITHSDPGFDSIFSGNTTDICPVGALTTVDFRFGARPWEMVATASICPHCPVGCNLTFNVRREARSDGQVVIKRSLPRQNEAVNELWLCDKGRFAYHYADGRSESLPTQRLTTPLVRKDGKLVPASWDEALGAAAEGLRQAGEGLLTLASGRLSNEDLFNLRQLTTGMKGQTILDTYMAGGDLVAQVGVGQGTNFSNMGKGTTILVVACHLHEEAPIWWLRVKQAARRGATLIVANGRPTRLDRYAAHVLRYPYGSETTTILAMLNTLSMKRPDLGDSLPKTASFRETMKVAAETFAQAENAVILFGSDGLGLEGSRALAQACANLLIATNHTGRSNNGLIGVWPRANDQGAWDIGFRPLPDLAAALQQAKAAYIVASDPLGDQRGTWHPSTGSGQAVARGTFLVVQDLFLTETAQHANVVLPTQPFTERHGTFTSGERRVQHYEPALPPRSDRLPDYAITAQLAARLGLSLEEHSAENVFARMTAEIPDYAGLSYRQLAETAEQWPVVGPHDLYFGGTAFKNQQGLGVQLVPAAQRGQNPSLAWPQAEATDVPEECLIAVPITRLYDYGVTVYSSELLRRRIGEPFVALNPADAERFRLAAAGSESLLRVSLTLHGSEFSATAYLDEDVPPGVALVPRSFGFPIDRPTAVTLQPANLQTS